MATVLLTRPRERSSETDEFHRILSSAGIAIVEIPLTSISFPEDLTELDAALHRAAQGNYDFLFLFSPTAVNFFEQRARRLGILDQIRSNISYAAIGSATASALRAIGMESVDIIRSEEENNVSTLAKFAGKKVLLLQSHIGLETAANALRTIGAWVERVTLYETNGPSKEDSDRLRTVMTAPNRPDVIAFFSPSAVTNFAGIIAEGSPKLFDTLPALAAIGETTADAVRETLHRAPDILAPKPDQASFAHEIIRFLEKR